MIMSRNLPDTNIYATGKENIEFVAGLTNNVVGYGSCICLGILNWSISKIQN